MNDIVLAVKDNLENVLCFGPTWTINGRQHGMDLTWTRGPVRYVNHGFSICISALLISSTLEMTEHYFWFGKNNDFPDKWYDGLQFRWVWKQECWSCLSTLGQEKISC